ncbi:MAG TPA: hypothetical protein GXX75_21755 [Clostridiales bacterium]|nr:hypothetical protein [Clostridiales bacterium]
MKAIVYLLVTRFKNQLLSLKKKPGMLILYLFVFLMIVGSLVFLVFAGVEGTGMDYADERILLLIIGGVALFLLYTFVYSGLSTGSSLFTMPDVGLLFVSPVSSKKILLYGLISTLGKSLLGGIFIFYQIANLRNNFGYGMKEILSLFIVFVLVVVFGQLLAIGIYIFSNGNEKRKRLVKTLVYLAYAGILLSVVYVYQRYGVGAWEAALRVVSSSGFGYIPIAGWGTMFFMGVVNNSLFEILLSLGLFTCLGAVMILVLTSGKADYYEDVLVSTETTYQTLQAAKEGRRVARQGGKKIKVKEQEHGIGKGSGASTLMYKHLLEMRRKSRFIFLDGYTLFLVVGAGAAGYYFKKEQLPQGMDYLILGLAAYIQYFVSIMGKLKEELTKPYIYLIPESSIKKVIAASATSLLKPCVDGVLIFLVYVVVRGMNPLTGVFFAAAYAASGAVFTALTILYQRVLGDQPNKLVQMFFCFGILLLILAPSIGVSIAAAFLLPDALAFLVTLPYTGFCILFTILLFLLNGNLIDKAEFTGR